MGSVVSHTGRPQMVQGPCGFPDTREGDGKNGPALSKDGNESQVNCNRVMMAAELLILFSSCLGLLACDGYRPVHCRQVDDCTSCANGCRCMICKLDT